MMDSIKLPANLASNPLVMIALVMLGGILKDVVVAVLRGMAKKWKSDKDPNNDALADGVEAAANAIDKAGLPKIK
jgi:hypothetical protein